MQLAAPSCGAGPGASSRHRLWVLTAAQGYPRHQQHIRATSPAQLPRPPQLSQTRNIRGASRPPPRTRCCTASAPPGTEARTPSAAAPSPTGDGSAGQSPWSLPCGSPPQQALELGFSLTGEQWEISPRPAGAAGVVASQKL